MFTIIVAIGKNNEIGKDNKLLFKLKNDLSFFKKTTFNSKVVMGRKTFESLPKRLDKRDYFIITKNKDFDVDYATIITDVPLFITENKDTKEEIFVIGGAKIYELFLPFTKKMYVTEIEEEYPSADCFFPKINKKEWKRKVLDNICENGTIYSHVLFEKK